MQKLKEANLYRSELIPISGKLVERYNKCLVKLGFLPTELTTFSIDGIGWSPEISEEKKDSYYLNNGEANSHCIIITPLQKGLPVYNPFHSFDREMMKAVFKKHSQKIEDITRDAAICVDFDQGIDVFYEPLDVLKYKNVSIRFHLINDLDKAKEEQLKLIRTFNEGNNFIDENIHNQLLASAKKYGDLRDRDLNLEVVNYETNSFYTKAFGGIYVLRDFILPILVFEDEKAYKEAIKDTVLDILMYHISHTELVDKLKSHSIIECDLESELTKKRHDRIKKYIFSSYLTETNHPLKNILEDGVLFKSYLNKIPVEARKIVMGVEIYQDKIKIDDRYKLENFIGNNFYFALHNPHSSLTANHQDLIWKLLVNISPKDVLFLYWYDKSAFYELYKTWNDSLKEWVIENIKTNI